VGPDGQSQSRLSSPIGRVGRHFVSSSARAGLKPVGRPDHAVTAIRKRRGIRRGKQPPLLSVFSYRSPVPPRRPSCREPAADPKAPPPQVERRSLAAAELRRCRPDNLLRQPSSRASGPRLAPSLAASQRPRLLRPSPATQASPRRSAPPSACRAGRRSARVDQPRSAAPRAQPPTSVLEPRGTSSSPHRAAPAAGHDTPGCAAPRHCPDGAEPCRPSSERRATPTSRSRRPVASPPSSPSSTVFARSPAVYPHRSTGPPLPRW
jgi:hypothetical protein